MGERSKYVGLGTLLEKFGVSRQAVCQWRKQGLPCRRSGRSWKYNLEVVGAWLKERELITGRQTQVNKTDQGTPPPPGGKKTRGESIEVPKTKTEVKKIKEEIEKTNHESEGSEGGLLKSIEQLNSMRRAIFDLAETSIKNKDTPEANRLLMTFKELIETLRKAAKDDIEIRKQVGEIILKSEAEEFCKLLCSTFKTTLYRQVDEIAQEILTGMIAAAVGIKSEFHDTILVKIREMLNEKFDNILGVLQRIFDEKSEGKT